MPIPILLISAGLFHPNLLARVRLEQRLARSREFTIFRSRNLEELPLLEWSDFSAVVLYFHHQKATPEALESLDEYTQLGGGVLAIHSASASFKGDPGYQNVLGGRFISHAAVESFRVEPDPAYRDVFGIAAPFTLRDEVYRHEWDPANQVHFWVKTPTGREPLVWTREHGLGRVCYCAAGHTAASMSSPQVQQILTRGLRWAAREE